MVLVVDELIAKPTDMLDRDREWASLAGFVTGSDPKLKVGIVSGRRRHGKSFLLQHLARRFGDGLGGTAFADRSLKEA